MRNRGITFSYYLDVYEYEFLQKSVEYDGLEPTDENVRAKAKAITKEALREHMAYVFERYKSEQTGNSKVTLRSLLKNP